MKSNSDHYPELAVESNGKTQVRFNILKVTRQEMDGSSRTSYDFDYVEIEGDVVKEKVVEAILVAAKPAKPSPIVVIEPKITPTKLDITVMVTIAITEAIAIVKLGPAAIDIALKPVVEPIKEPLEPPIKEPIKP